MLKKTLLGFGFAASLALASAIACESSGKASGTKASAAVPEGASPASGATALASDIVAERKASGHGEKGQCLRKSATGKSASAEAGSSAQCKRSAKAGQASASGDQNVASSGFDCPKSADRPKADCDRSACLKKSGKAEAGTDGDGKPAAEAKVGTEI